MFCIMLYYNKQKTAGTNEGTNEGKQAVFFQRLQRRGKGRTRPRFDGREHAPPVYSYGRRFSQEAALSYPLQPSHLLLPPSHLFCPYSTARFSSSRQTVQYVLCSRSLSIHFMGSAGSPLQQVKSNWKPGGGGCFSFRAENLSSGYGSQKN